MKPIIFLLMFVLLIGACGERKPEKLKMVEVVAAFRNARLPLGQLQYFNANSDPAKMLGKPNQYIEKVTWQTTEEIVHTILAFDNEADLQSAATQMEAEVQADRPNADYVFVHKNILVRINYQIYLATAIKYREALNAL